MNGYILLPKWAAPHLVPDANHLDVVDGVAIFSKKSGPPENQKLQKIAAVSLGEGAVVYLGDAPLELAQE